jgi:hypothetical protein
VGVVWNTGPVKPRIASLSIIVADAPESSKMQTMPGLPVPITFAHNFGAFVILLFLLPVVVIFGQQYLTRK